VANSDFDYVLEIFATGKNPRGSEKVGTLFQFSEVPNLTDHYYYTPLWAIPGAKIADVTSVLGYRLTIRIQLINLYFNFFCGNNYYLI